LCNPEYILWGAATAVEVGGSGCHGRKGEDECSKKMKRRVKFSFHSSMEVYKEGMEV